MSCVKRVAMRCGILAALLAAARVRAADSTLTLFDFNDLPPTGTTVTATRNRLSGTPKVLQSGHDTLAGGGTGVAFTDADGVAFAAGKALCFNGGLSTFGDQIQFTFQPSGSRSLVLSYDVNSSTQTTAGAGAPGATVLYRLSGGSPLFNILGTDAYPLDSIYHVTTWSLSKLIPGISATGQVQIVIMPQEGAGSGTVCYDNLQLSGVRGILGDANGDGRVDFSDLVVLAQHYGVKTGATWADGDFNNDGAVGFSDLVTLAQGYNARTTAVAEDRGALVPEPMTLGAVLSAGCASLWRGRRS